MVSSFSRPAHDGLYGAIDTYLKVHPGINRSERKRICRLFDCKKLSADACIHAVQNERLPLRVVVQVLFFEQVRASASSSSSTPDLPKAIKDLNFAACGRSRSATTNADEDWDAVASAAELRASRVGNGVLHERNYGDNKINSDKAAISKMKGLITSKKIFSKIWSSKSGQATENNGSDLLGFLMAILNFGLIKNFRNQECTSRRRENWLNFGLTRFFLALTVFGILTLKYGKNTNLPNLSRFNKIR